jgi:hypothetical protein
MLITRRLKLVSPLLAGKRNNDKSDPKCEFVKLPIPKGEPEDRVYLMTPLARWNWAFLEARDALSLEDVAVSAIIPCRWYSAKRTSTYIRRYRRGHQQTQTKYESLSSGQVIETRFTLSKHIPPGTDGGGRFNRAPDEEEFDQMLTHIGEYLGMSEWGNDYLYGRFEIKTHEANDETQ